VFCSCANASKGYSSFPVRGNFDFNGQINATTAAAALADFAIGAEDTATRNILSGEVGMRSFQIAGYAQDAWRITDRFTIEYGLRYEVHDHWANLNIATGQLLVTSLNGNGRRLRNTDFNTAGPRLGLAYTLDNSRKTVLRGGFGMSYVDTLIGGQQLYKNLPYYFA
jgi:outer membrane receptor protein involved in Fe transport